jgi:LacI family transcriptional regulator
MAMTLKKLAKILNCDVSTVSRALNNRPGHLSQETRTKIIELAEETGYISNQNAQSLSFGKTNLIGVMVRYVSDSIFSRYIEAIDKYFSAQNYSVIPFISYENPEKERACLATLQRKQIDAMICLYYDKENELFYKRLKSQGFHIIFRAADVEEIIDFDSVQVDVSEGYGKLCQYLFNKNRRKIAVLGGHIAEEISSGHSAFHSRSFLRSHETAGIKLDKRQGIPCENTSDDAYMKLYSYLQNSSYRPDALIVQSPDKLAGAYKAIIDNKLKIPDDINICVIGDMDICRMLPVSVTSWVPPLEKIAEALANLTLQRLREPNLQTQHIHFESRLLERESTNTHIKKGY